MVKLRNLIMFLVEVTRYGLAPWKWRRAWRACQDEHLAEVRKGIWELKKQGKVRQDKEGRLFWVKD
jgi:hypothetical protein